LCAYSYTWEQRNFNKECDFSDMLVRLTYKKKVVMMKENGELIEKKKKEKKGHLWRKENKLLKGKQRSIRSFMQERVL